MLYSSLEVKQQYLCTITLLAHSKKTPQAADGSNAADLVREISAPGEEKGHRAMGCVKGWKVKISKGETRDGHLRFQLYRFFGENKQSLKKNYNFLCPVACSQLLT